MKTFPHAELTGIDLGAVQAEADRMGSDFTHGSSVCGVPFHATGLWKIHMQHLADR